MNERQERDFKMLDAERAKLELQRTELAAGVP
jgi:hypothetical protein